MEMNLVWIRTSWLVSSKVQSYLLRPPPHQSSKLRKPYHGVTDKLSKILETPLIAYFLGQLKLKTMHLHLNIYLQLLLNLHLPLRIPPVSKNYRTAIKSSGSSYNPNHHINHTSCNFFFGNHCTIIYNFFLLFFFCTSAHTLPVSSTQRLPSSLPVISGGLTSLIVHYIILIFPVCFHILLF
ncbi:hypothetical protein BGW37DRAFT_506750 [Umbelopsis sp. PMI_123]|nr:hypothetical protein BGW37DRAFT_506750 [Umbelopsis sp. PMI_123]